MVDEDLHTAITTISEITNTSLSRISILAERIDTIMDTQNERTKNLLELDQRLIALEKKRQTSILIPLIVGAYAIGISTLALVTTILFQLLNHIVNDIH